MIPESQNPVAENDQSNLLRGEPFTPAARGYVFRGLLAEALKRGPGGAPRLPLSAALRSIGVLMKPAAPR